MLEAESITCAYGAHKAIDRVSLSIEPGSLTAVLGPNGAGKTTLLLAMTGGTTPSTGTVRLDGKPLAAYGSRELARRRAVLHQFSRLSFNFSVREVVEMGRYVHERREDHDHDASIVEDAFAAADIQPLAKRQFLTLSGGERQRVQLARALAQIWPAPEQESPAYLFLDEPTSNLDLAHQHRTLKIARDFARRGLGVCAILHDLNLALHYADRVALLERGRLVAEGPTAETLTPERVEAVFSVRARLLSDGETSYLVTEEATPVAN